MLLMERKRILLVNEASFLGTGYGVYGHELFTRLHNTDRYELCELGVWASANEHATLLKEIPWGVIPNAPVSKQEEPEYLSDPLNKWGAWKFEDACLFFKPDFVISFRDWWMDEFIGRSPFRRHFHYLNMPPIDSLPQDPLWIASYFKADRLFTYTEWAKKAIERETAGKAVVSDILPPAADASIFKSVENKIAHKNKMGLSDDSIVVGTVMRNQARKLYQDLFFSFAKITEKLPKDLAKRVHLLCHVSYPDLHHDIPKLVRDCGVGSKIIFSYFCKRCKGVFLSVFRDAKTYCQHCRADQAQMPIPGNDVTREDLAAIYNCMDVYVQYSTNEGFGMPLVEAAYCGVPIVGPGWSATQSILETLGGVQINPCRFFQDSGVSPYRSLPDNVQFVNIMADIITSEKYKQMGGHHLVEKAKANFCYDRTAEGWIDAIESLTPKNTWGSPPRFKDIVADAPTHLPNYEFVEWCATKILQEPDAINDYRMYKVLRNLNYNMQLDARYDRGMNRSGIESDLKKKPPYTKAIALQEFINIATKYNKWEEKRWNLLGAKQ